MAETAQTMTEFTYAPGEQDIVGDRFSPSVIIFSFFQGHAAQRGGR